MRQLRNSIAWLVLSVAGFPASPAHQVAVTEPETPLRLRPAALAQNVDEFAGQRVILTGARAVGMFGTRALVVDGAVRMDPAPGHRDRILVLIQNGEISVRPDLLVGSTVQVNGVARTILGMQLTGEVPWPVELDRERLDRLDIRAALVATSVRTADGVELTK